MTVATKYLVHWRVTSALRDMFDGGGVARKYLPDNGGIVLTNGDGSVVLVRVHELNPASLAERFAAKLQEELGSAHFALIRECNSAEEDPSICHSHDYCDANVVMQETLEEAGVPVFGDDGEMSEWVQLMFNQVWELARFEFLGGRKNVE